MTKPMTRWVTRFHCPWLAVLTAILLSGCASRLPRERQPKVPTGISSAERLDLFAIRFTDLTTRQAVNLGEYMEGAGLDHILLTFGSKNCAACNRKAKALTESVIDRHPLYLTDVGRHFKIIGINTDPAPDRLGGYIKDFPFIRWSDPSGEAMVNHFAPAGSRFRVPLTVMLRKDGILWRVLADDHTSVEAMMRHVEETLGLSADGSGSLGGGSSTRDGEGLPASADPAPTTARSRLAMMGGSRFKNLEVTGCDGRKSTIEDLWSQVQWKFVQVIKGPCIGACLETAATIRGLAAACRERGLGSCAAVTLMSGDPQGAAGSSSCETGSTFWGSDAFLKVFGSHFDWHYPKDVDATGQPYLTRGVDGPFVMGFAQDGRLIFSQEGDVSQEQLLTAIKEQNPRQHARGPDFPLYNIEKDSFTFADWRLQSRYTVVMGWSTICTSCDAQLKHWSQPGQLVDFCAARPQDCQVGAVENIFPGSAETLSTYFQTLINGIYDDRGRPTYDGFTKLGIRVPLLLDPVADGPGSLDYLGRLHDGYMLAASRDVPPEHINDFRTFVYDQEGKIVARFYGETLKDEEDDPVLKSIKQFLDEDRSNAN